MRRRLTLAWVVAAVLGGAPAAMADHWPVAGGTPSRSGNAAMDPGETPISPAWNLADGRVRTPIIISGGGGPDTQRVAYGTADGFAHIRRLSTGEPIGPPEGTDMDSGNLTNDEGQIFGTTGSVGFADTSTEDRLGQLYVLHNDEATTVYSVFLAKLRLDSGELVSEEVIPSTSNCAVNSSPMLTPPTAGGSRVLYFVMACAQGVSRYLVRIPIQGDATSPSATIGTAGFALVEDLNDTAAPTLVVLRDDKGTPRYHVAVGRTGGVTLFDADDPLESLPGTTAKPPAITGAFADAGEVGQSPVAPTAPSGLVAGAEGSGTGPAPALFVAAAEPGGNTKVYRFVQDGNGRTLRAERATPPLPDSGAPASAMAVAETVTPGGVSAGGTLVVTTAKNAILLRTADLSEAGRASTSPLPDGSGFARTAAAVSGNYAYLVRDGSTGTVPEHLVLRLDGLLPLTPPAFARAPDPVAGAVFGQPAISRGTVLFGTARGPFAYTTRDVTGPVVDLLQPADDASLSGTVSMTAKVGDPRGVTSVAFRLLTEGGSARVIGKATAPVSGSGFEMGTYAIDFPTASVGNGGYLLEATATDTTGNASTSARRRVKIANAGGVGGLPPGACANQLTGTAAADHITGSSAGDRILGGAGDDRLDGAAGHDCVLGQDGDDVLSGGTGDDLLEGAGGEDVLAGGAGRNRIDGGAGADVLRGGSGSERLNGGGGRDTILGGKGNDRLSGGSGNDVLRGESGSDRLAGGAGNDVLVGGGGSNRLDGGAGNDRLSAVNGRRDVVVCGSGRDRVTADRQDRVSRSCERVARRR